MLTYLDLSGITIVRRCLGCDAIADDNSLRVIPSGEIEECLPKVPEPERPSCSTGACGCRVRSPL